MLNNMDNRVSNVVKNGDNGNIVDNENIDKKYKMLDNFMDGILQASLGESSNKIRVTFKKTVNIRQYETEVIEAESTLELNETNITGVERELVCAILEAQLEYMVYVNLACKGLVTQTELINRKRELAKAVLAFKQKAENLTGRSMDKYFNYVDTT